MAILWYTCWEAGVTSKPFGRRFWARYLVVPGNETPTITKNQRSRASNSPDNRTFMQAPQYYVITACTIDFLASRTPSLQDIVPHRPSSSVEQLTGIRQFDERLLKSTGSPVAESFVRHEAEIFMSARLIVSLNLRGLRDLCLDGVFAVAAMVCIEREWWDL